MRRHSKVSGFWIIVGPVRRRKVILVIFRLFNVSKWLNGYWKPRNENRGYWSNGEVAPVGRTLHLGRVWSLGPRRLAVGPWGCVSQHWGRCCLELVLVSQELRRGALRAGTQISEDESLSCCYLWGSSVRLIWPWEFQNQIQTKPKPK